jgi:hypothetical protein
VISVTVRQVERAAGRGLSAPPAGRYTALRNAGSRTVRYQNVATGEIVSRRQIANARRGASFEQVAKKNAKPGQESPIKRYYREVRLAQRRDKSLTFPQARRRVSRRRRDGFRHFVTSHQRRYGTSQRKAEHEVRQALATLNKPRRAQSDRERTQALRAIGRVGEDEFYSGGTLLTTGFEGR